MAACMWGGMLCPLIPVGQALPKPWRGEPFRRPTPLKVARGYLRFFEPDVFVQTADGQFDLAGMKADLGRDVRRRFIDFDELVHKQINAAPVLTLGVDMFSVYAHLYRTEFQFQKRHPNQNLMFKPGERIGEAFCETAYGMFPDGFGLDHVARGFHDAVEAKIVSPDADAWRAVTAGANFPLNYTMHGLETRFGGYHDPAVFIFDPLNGADVIDAWNFRLISRDPVMVNVHWLEASRDSLLEMIKANHRPLPTNPNGVMIGTTLHIARSLDAEAVVRRLDLPLSDLPQRSLSVQTWYEPLWQEVEDDRIHRPQAVEVSAAYRETQVAASLEPRATIPVPVLAPAFEARFTGHGPAWINVIRVRSYASDSPFAEVLPSAALAETQDYPLRAFEPQFPTREGFVTFRKFAMETGRFELATREQAVASWLKGQGLVATTSEAGRITDQIIASLGGLWGTHQIKHPEIIQLLDKMARSRVVRSGGDSEEFPDSTAPAQTWIATLKRVDQKRPAADQSLQRLVDANVLKLGLAPRCSHCNKENWYSLDDVASTLRCERCRKDYAYPQGKPSAVPWKYRLVGPFVTPHFAQGGYCVALTLAFLEGLSSMEPLTFTTSLDLVTGTGARLETDLFAWWGGANFGRAARDPSTLVGECKSLGNDGFKPQDISRLKALGEALPGAYLVVATLKRQFSSEEVRRLRQLSRWGWGRASGDRKPSRVIALTGVELFGDGPLSYDWKKAGGTLAQLADTADYVFDLTRLAEATQRGHLGFSDEEMFAMRYPPRKLTPSAALGTLLALR